MVRKYLVTEDELMSADVTDGVLTFTRDNGQIITAGTLLKGDQGERGLPGVNAVPTDEAVATYMRTPGTEVEQQLSATMGVIVGPLVADALAEDGDLADTVALLAGDAVDTYVAAPGFTFPGLPAQIVLRGSDPIVNTPGATITFPDETWIIAGNVRYVIAASTVVDFSPAPTTVPVLVMFNRDTQTFHRVLATNVAQVGNRKSVVVASISVRPGHPAEVWMPCRFTYNDLKSLNRSQEALLAESLVGTRQVPSFAGGVLQNVEHRDIATDAVVRRDTFTFTPTTITEVRSHLTAGRTVTLTTNRSTLVTEVS